MSKGVSTIGVKNNGEIIERNHIRYGIEITEMRIDLYGYDLVSLDIAEGIVTVWCDANDIESLVLPESMKFLECDKSVKGLEKYIGKVKMRLR